MRFQGYIEDMSRKLAVTAPLLLLIWLGMRFQQRPDPPVVQAAEIQISSKQFAEYVTALSEPEGYFDTDNFISNETSYLHVVPNLKERVRPGFVYLGVGPDQNFSYIVHTQPALAIIVDIRRQNMLEHLLYKALFELSANRAEFLAMLLSREPPAGQVPEGLSSLLSLIRRAPASRGRYEANLKVVRDRIAQYDLNLSNDDWMKIEYVYRTFGEEGLDLRFSSIGRNNASNYPTFQSLLLQTDRAGNAQGYLSSEELFQWMKRFETENRLLPIVGDFAGPKAFKTIAAFLKERGLAVSAFYTSNVEYYLFSNGQWDAYVNNVRSLPVAEDSVFIRAYFSNTGGTHPQNVPGHRSTTLLEDLPRFLRDEAAGRIRSYYDLVR